MGGDEQAQTESVAEPARAVEDDGAVTSADSTPGEAPAEGAAPVDGEAGGDAGPTLEDLELANTALRQRVAEYKDKMLRAAAELENVRRRTAKEVDDAKKFGIERILKDLLPVFDNFERALAHGKADDADPKAFMEGVEMVLGQLKGALERNGVTPFPSLGERFDPNLHEAIHSKETDEADPGTVVEEFQRGYKIHGRLARPAMVIVATKPAEPGPEPASVDDDDDDAEVEIEVEAKAATEPSDGASGGGVDLGDLQGDVEVIGATLANATGEMLDRSGAGYGAVITAVSELSPAARAGLQAGDVVTDVGSRQVMDARGFKRAVQQSLPKKLPFTIVYRRGGEAHETKVGGR